MQKKSKTYFTILAAVITTVIAGCTPNLPTDISPTSTSTVPASTAAITSKPEIPLTIDLPWEDRSIFSSGLISSERYVLNELPGASVYHIGFQISADFLTLIGWEEVHYTNTEDVPLEEIYFQLFPNSSGGKTTISNLSVDGQDVDIVTDFLNTALLVTLPTPLEVGNSIDIRMDFEVEVAQVMEGNYGLFGYFDGILVLDEFYPVIPVYDDEGWNVQAPPANADTSYFDTSFYVVKVTAPVNLVVAASGIEVERSQEGDTQTITFAAGPARDFYLAASENFNVTSMMVGETTINSYAIKGYETGSVEALRFTKDSFDSFNEHFGLYPYTEFDLLSTPMLALGIEYPGIVGIL